jgi:hypothetical protein
MEQTQDKLLFRWFIGLTMDDTVWVPTVFTKSRGLQRADARERQSKPHSRRSLLSACRRSMSARAVFRSSMALARNVQAQGAAVCFGLPHAVPLRVAPLAVNRQLDLRELKGSDDLL